MKTTIIKESTIDRIGILQEWSTILIRGMKDYCKQWIEEEAQIGFWDKSDFIYTSHGLAQLNIDHFIKYDNKRVSHFILLKNHLPVMVCFDNDDNIHFYNID